MINLWGIFEIKKMEGWEIELLDSVMKRKDLIKNRPYFVRIGSRQSSIHIKIWDIV